MAPGLPLGSPAVPSTKTLSNDVPFTAYGPAETNPSERLWTTRTVSSAVFRRKARAGRGARERREEDELSLRERRRGLPRPDEAPVAREERRRVVRLRRDVRRLAAGSEAEPGRPRRESSAGGTRPTASASASTRRRRSGRSRSRPPRRSRGTARPGASGGSPRRCGAGPGSSRAAWRGGSGRGSSGRARRGLPSDRPSAPRRACWRSAWRCSGPGRVRIRSESGKSKLAGSSSPPGTDGEP